MATTVAVTIPEKHTQFLSDESEVNSVLTECIMDYVEFKQDEDTRERLENNTYFSSLENQLEKKLGSL
ncbi:hypothetical protein MK079_05645 [Candidatus Gracilibacteria bacterium]|nr:hypothetical protein [Candidatus Gracilibacteria bacterium]